MPKLTKIQICWMITIFTCTITNPALSILSENKKQVYKLTPLQSEKPITQKPTSQSQKPQQEPIFPSSNNNPKKAREKVKIPINYDTKITITSERISSDNVTEVEPILKLPDVLSDLRRTLNKEKYYQFVPSTDENDFVTLSALDIITRDTQKSLSGKYFETVSVNKELACEAELIKCNNQLFKSISDRLEQIKFIKFTKQVMGEQITTPEIRIQTPEPFSKNKINLAFSRPNTEDLKSEQIYSKPSEFSYSIKEILKNKEAIFGNSETGFTEDLKTLQSQLELNQLNPNLVSKITRTSSQTKESALSSQSTEQTMTQLNNLVEFISAKKIVINDEIVIGNASSKQEPSELLTALKQEASDITSLRDLLGYYVSESDRQLDKNNKLNSQILTWLQDYNNLIDIANRTTISDDTISDKNFEILSMLQDKIRFVKQDGVELSDAILNSKEGLMSFSDILPELSELNERLTNTQENFLFNDLDLMMSQTANHLNKILTTLSDENIDECYKIFKKHNIKVSTICNLSTVDNHVKNGDLITLQLNEGVVYMGQIEDNEEALDKYKYV